MNATTTTTSSSSSSTTTTRFYSLEAAEAAFVKLFSKTSSPDYQMGFPGALDAPRFGIFEIEYFDTRGTGDYEFKEVRISYETAGEDGFRLIQKTASESRVLMDWGWCHDQNTFWH